MATHHATPTAEDVHYLTELLSSERCSEGALNIHQLRGFLWAVICSPVTLMTQDWLPIVLGEVIDGEEPFESQESLEHFLTVIFKFYHETLQQWTDKEVRFPPEYIYSDDAALMQPLTNWCEGLLIGHDWLEDIWTEASVDIELEDGSSLQEPLETILAIIALFADVPATLAEADDAELLKAKLALSFNEGLSVALLQYARIGHELRRLAEELAKVYAKTGRNDPCPCGSGKKFKKCCLP